MAAKFIALENLVYSNIDNNKIKINNLQLIYTNKGLCKFSLQMQLIF